MMKGARTLHEYAVVANAIANEPDFYDRYLDLVETVSACADLVQQVEECVITPIAGVSAIKARLETLAEPTF